MLRTLGVFVTGTLVGVAVLTVLIWVGLHVQGRFGPYAYYLIDILTGAIVGLFVGFLQRKRAGIVALVCLLPLVFVQYVNRFSQSAAGTRLFLLLLGTTAELLIAVVVAHRLSAARNNMRNEPTRA